MRQWGGERREVLTVGEVREKESDKGTNYDIMPVIYELTYIMVECR